MDEQTKQAVAKALDNSLTTVAMWEYNHLAHSADISNKVRSALNSLGELSKPFGKIPNYDEWDSLFYHWYQPSQINLAYSVIKSTAEVSDKLRVVDFGCGALAMQFGVALATADSLEQMQPISEIRINSLDTSQAMVEMGRKIWEQFKIEVSRDSKLRYLSLACETINAQAILTNTSMVAMNADPDEQSKCWVSAFHTVYDESKDNVQSWLKSIVDRLNPDICFATTRSSKTKSELLEDVWGFMNYDEYHLPPLTIKPQFRGTLPEITQWRRNLNSALQIDHRYLNRPVTWEWPNAAFMIHAKGSMPMDADDLPW